MAFLDFFMFDLAYSAKDSGKKKFKKLDGQTDFWAWLKNGPKWLPTMKMAEIKKSFFLPVLPIT